MRGASVFRHSPRHPPPYQGPISGLAPGPRTAARSHHHPATKRILCHDLSGHHSLLASKPGPKTKRVILLSNPPPMTLSPFENYAIKPNFFAAASSNPWHHPGIIRHGRHKCTTFSQQGISCRLLRTTASRPDRSSNCQPHMSKTQGAGKNLPSYCPKTRVSAWNSRGSDGLHKCRPRRSRISGQTAAQLRSCRGEPSSVLPDLSGRLDQPQSAERYRIPPLASHRFDG